MKWWSNTENSQNIGLSKAFQQGISFVETIRVVKGRPLYLEAHLDRLYGALADFSLMPYWPKARLFAFLNSGELTEDYDQGRLRLQSFDVENKHFIFATVDGFSYPDNLLDAEGLVMHRSPSVRPVVDRRYRYKTNQYFSAWIEQQSSMGDEWLYENTHGWVAEGTKSNVFFVKDHRFYTPAIECNILDGVMRNQVIKRIENEGFDLFIGYYTIEDIMKADHLLITNALMPVAPIARFDGKAFKPLDLELKRILQNL